MDADRAALSTQAPPLKDPRGFFAETGPDPGHKRERPPIHVATVRDATKHSGPLPSPVVMSRPKPYSSPLPHRNNPRQGRTEDHRDDNNLLPSLRVEAPLRRTR